MRRCDHEDHHCRPFVTTLFSQLLSSDHDFAIQKDSEVIGSEKYSSDLVIPQKEPTRGLRAQKGALDCQFLSSSPENPSPMNKSRRRFPMQFRIELVTEAYKNRTRAVETTIRDSQERAERVETSERRSEEARRERERREMSTSDRTASLRPK